MDTLSRLDAPEPTGELLPYEQTQLRLLLNQFHAASPRIQSAFLDDVAVRSGFVRVVHARRTSA